MGSEQGKHYGGLALFQVIVMPPPDKRNKAMNNHKSYILIIIGLASLLVLRECQNARKLYNAHAEIVELEQQIID